ncbi:MAG: HesA/MoeB/ThiF family protein [Candidatus Woesearchaeota archaeon]
MSYICNEQALGQYATQKLATSSVNVIGDSPGARNCVYNLVGLGVPDIHWYVPKKSAYTPHPKSLEHVVGDAVSIFHHDCIMPLAHEGMCIDASYDTESQQKTMYIARAMQQPVCILQNNMIQPVVYSQSPPIRLDNGKPTKGMPFTYMSALSGIVAANIARKHIVPLDHMNERPLPSIYAPTIPLPLDAYLQKRPKALVVGAGGIGTFALLHLALNDAVSIDVIDNDTVEDKNLNRQILYRHHIGKPKVDAAQQVLQTLSKTRITPIHIRLDRQNMNYCIRQVQQKEYDYIFCCVDNVETRKILDKVHALTGVPLIEGGCDSFSGTMCQVKRTTKSLREQRKLHTLQDEVEDVGCVYRVNPSTIIPNALIGTIMAYHPFFPHQIPKNTLLELSTLTQQPVRMHKMKN